MQAACCEESEGQGESERQGYWGALTRPSATLSQRERGWIWGGTSSGRRLQTVAFRSMYNVWRGHRYPAAGSPSRPCGSSRCSMDGPTGTMPVGFTWDWLP